MFVLEVLTRTTVDGAGRGKPWVDILDPLNQEDRTAQGVGRVGYRMDDGSRRTWTDIAGSHQKKRQIFNAVPRCR